MGRRKFTTLTYLKKCFQREETTVEEAVAVEKALLVRTMSTVQLKSHEAEPGRLG